MNVCYLQLYKYAQYTDVMCMNYEGGYKSLSSLFHTRITSFISVMVILFKNIQKDFNYNLLSYILAYSSILN